MQQSTNPDCTATLGKPISWRMALQGSSWSSAEHPAVARPGPARKAPSLSGPGRPQAQNQAQPPQPRPLTRPPLLFGHQLLDFPLLFLLLNFSFFVDLLYCLWALVCPPRNPVALKERKEGRRKGRLMGRLCSSQPQAWEGAPVRREHSLQNPLLGTVQTEESQRLTDGSNAPLPASLPQRRRRG